MGTPVWTWLAILESTFLFAAMRMVQYEGSWTAVERLYCRTT